MGTDFSVDAGPVLWPLGPRPSLGAPGPIFTSSFGLTGAGVCRAESLGGECSAGCGAQRPAVWLGQSRGLSGQGRLPSFPSVLSRGRERRILGASKQAQLPACCLRGPCDQPRTPSSAPLLTQRPHPHSTCLHTGPLDPLRLERPLPPALKQVPQSRGAGWGRRVLLPLSVWCPRRLIAPAPSRPFSPVGWGDS